MASDIKLTVNERGGRLYVQSSAPWEAVVGYSRAVRSGPWIAVTGTVGRNADGTYPSTAAEQTRRALAILSAALEALGAGLHHVIRTRMFVTDIASWEEIGREHGAVFGEIRPATTMVEVRKLIDAEAMVEIEADALVPLPGPDPALRLAKRLMQLIRGGSAQLTPDLASLVIKHQDAGDGAESVKRTAARDGVRVADGRRKRQIRAVAEHTSEGAIFDRFKKDRGRVDARRVLKEDLARVTSQDQRIVAVGGNEYQQASAPLEGILRDRPRVEGFERKRKNRPSRLGRGGGGHGRRWGRRRAGDQRERRQEQSAPIQG